RFTDLCGTWHHMSFHRNALNMDNIDFGITFDGSSIPGWKSIDDSDMVLIPDANNTVVDQLTEQPSIIIFCNIYDPRTRQEYTRDPRSIARRAEDYLKASGIADTCYMGPEPEFFVFDDVYYETNGQSSFYTINSVEGSYPAGPLYKNDDIRRRN